jgi:WD40 repeat protein
VKDSTVSAPYNPFPGLRPFREDEEDRFFGRENQVDAMVDKLAATRFLAVVGTSGSGKSSLVNCGLRPALRQGLMARAGTAWRMAQFRPGNDPIRAMATALAQDGVLFSDHAAADLSLADIIEATLRMSKLGLIDICEQAALGEGVNLLVVVDQFEELFRYSQLEAAGLGGDQGSIEQATAFVNLLLEVKERTSCPIYIVLTMRSDFLGDCTKFPGLAEAINTGQYLVPRMTRDERRAAIERPVGVGGAAMAPVLLTRLVNDVGDNPDQLSILQHALNRTWARWQNEGARGPLELAHYEAIGTMAHALDQHAERAYADLAGDRQQLICEKLFKALTDKATDPRGVRRPTTLATLCALAGATAAEVTEVIEVFRRPSRSFLMPPADEQLKPETVIDISHESLMRVWERLIKWADEEAQSARSYRRLAEAAENHAAGEASLWRDPELQLALDWRDKNQPNETWAARYHPGFPAAMQFLAESSEAREAERTERQRLRQRELDAQREKAETQARFARRRLWATVISVALAGVALIFALKAHQASVIAEASRAKAQTYLSDAQVAKARSLIKAAEDRKNDQSRNILLALETLPDVREAIDRPEVGERPVVGDAQKMLSRGIDNLRELAVTGGYGSMPGVGMSPAGARIVTSSDDGTALILDAATGTRLSELKGHTGKIRTAVMTPDGARCITASEDNTARIWDARTGAELHTLEGHAADVVAVAVTPDGTRIVTGSSDGTARIWDAGSGAELRRFDDHPGPLIAVAVTPDGSRIVTSSSDRIARVWDAGNGTELFELKGHTGPILAVAVTPDGARIITGSDDRTARIWNATNGAQLRSLPHAGAVSDVIVDPKGSRALTSSGSGIMRMWDIRSGALLFELLGHTGQITSMAISPDGARIITGSDDHTARLWDATTDTELFELTIPTGIVLAVAATPDGSRIATGSTDKIARLWDAATGAEIQRFEGHSGLVSAVAVTRDGARLVTGSQDKTVRIWDAGTGTLLYRLEGHRGTVWSVAVTPDGTRVVTSSQDGTVRIWDAGTGTELRKLEGLTAPVLAVAVMPDGARIITGSSDSVVRLWDVDSGAELSELTGDNGLIRSVAVTPDGTRIISGFDDGTVRVWDVRAGRGLQLTGHDAAVRSVAVTPDGSGIVSGSDDGTLRVWDLGTMQELIRGRTGRVQSVAVMPDGARVVTAADGVARVWAFAQLQASPPQHRFNTADNLQAAVEEAKRDVPRCLSIKERKDFLLEPRPPNWCIDMGKYPYNTDQWRSWRAGKDVTDATISNAYANFADEALMKGGAVKTAFDAAELSIQFDPPPKKKWLTVNHAHALMLSDKTDEARREYLRYRGEPLEVQHGKLWETAILEDFQKLRDNGRWKKLMDEIELAFKPQAEK